MASLSPVSSKTSPSSESFAALFEESLNRKEMRIGEVITAEVLSIDDNFVVVNAGLKSESTIAIEEFRNDAGQMEVKPGDFVSVSIEACVTLAIAGTWPSTAVLPGSGGFSCCWKE